MCAVVFLLFNTVESSATTGKVYVKKQIREIAKKYPDGSKFNRKVEYYDSGMDAMVKVAGGCNGFVAYVTNKIFGEAYSDSEAESYKVLGSASTSNNKKMKKLFKKAKIGDVILWYSKSGRRHMGLFMSYSSKGVKVYEANFGGKNRVRYNHLWPWKKMKTWPTGGASKVLVARYKKYNK